MVPVTARNCSGHSKRGGEAIVRITKTIPIRANLLGYITVALGNTPVETITWRVLERGTRHAKGVVWKTLLKESGCSSFNTPSRRFAARHLPRAMKREPRPENFGGTSDGFEAPCPRPCKSRC